MEHELTEEEQITLISKNQLKKLKKREDWEKNKQEIKQKLKEKEKMKKEEKRKEREKQIEDKNELPLKEEKIEESVFSKLKKEKIEEFINKSKTGIPVIVDCNFEELMTDKEITSIAKQINFIYSKHKRSTDPFRFIFFNTGEKILNAIKKKGSDSWKGIEIIEKGSWDELKKIINVDSLVYLTGDSENELTTLNSNNAYIIGGIVDRNRYKNLTYDLAIKNNLQHAKLPIADYLHLKSSSILATNHIFDILSTFNDMEKKDWSKAFESIIPKRKQD